MVILWWQCPSLFADDLASAAFAAVDAGMIWRAAWAIFFVKGGVGALRKVGGTLV
jgi:hypothetical protein